MKRFLMISLFMLGIATLAGCSSKEYYRAGRAWQEEQCFRIDDIHARDRCLSNASISYEQYKRDVDAAPKAQ